MNITVIGRKCTPRDAFKERAERKLSKIDRFFDTEADAKITVTIEKTMAAVEVTVNSNGLIFRSQERAVDMNDALDACIDSIIRKIRKNKTKVEKKLRAGALDSYAFGEYLDDEEAEYEVVRTKEVPLKPQSVEEAILQMNMLGHQFYMFLDDASGEVNVVYRRADGGYGLLVPTQN
ncbi:MAG: ribosome-associated translation inhibitor RaiA [Clostridia bacterium]|nr:ribosome-associated translation inhibitor RaiA [Clostridia bacterium]